MVVPPKHPKMIIFSRKTPWLLGTTILGNLHIPGLFQNMPWNIRIPEPEPRSTGFHGENVILHDPLGIH